MTRFLAWICGLLAGGHALAGVVGDWRFDRVENGLVKDASPKGNHGLVQEAEVRNGLLHLDGLGGHVAIVEKAPFGFSNALSACIWVNPADLKPQTVIFGVPNATETWTTPMFGMYIVQNRVVFGLWGDRGASKTLVESSAELATDAWTFLAGTYDGSTAKLYVNGVLSAQAPHQGNVVRNGLPLLIGKGLGFSKPCFKGEIGELRLYENALREEEVRAAFEQARPGYDAKVPARKNFGDGTVKVETHRNSPDSKDPWRSQETRLLELVKGFHPSGATVTVDRFGGRTDRPQEKVTGFFYVKAIDGRQWLIDPEGHRFFHVGINAVRWTKRGGGAVPEEQWAAATTDELRALGFNGLGNWSSTALQQVKEPLVWVRRHNFMFEFAKQKGVTEPASGTVGFRNRCMPVFDPGFEPFCREYAKELADTAQDPALLGIMTDNELQCPVDLLDRYLSLEEADPGRQAAAAWLASRNNGAPITLRDRYQFIAFAFERYYRVVTSAVRAVDPNHLYLGSRINYRSGQFDNPWFWQALTPFHDVVSVNYYGAWGPNPKEVGSWAAWSGKPVVFTEWYAKAMDVPGLANTKGAGWLVHTQEDRARYYQHFALGALELKNVVGWHWFKYMDDPQESVALDSAGGANKGMFDLQGRGYPPLVERARAINREVYPLIEFFDARAR